MQLWVSGAENYSVLDPWTKQTKKFKKKLEKSVLVFKKGLILPCYQINRA